MYWQGYGPQSVEEKQKLLRLLRNLNFNGESVSEPYTPTAQSLGTMTAADGFYSPELRGEFGAGLLDLHAMDDTELLSEVIIDSLYVSKCYYFGGIQDCWFSSSCTFITYAGSPWVCLRLVLECDKYW